MRGFWAKEKNMHKFILGENPQGNGDSGLWIIHLPKPQAIIEVIHEDSKVHSKIEDYSLNSYYKNPNGVTETIRLKLYFLFSTLFMSKDAEIKLKNKILKEAWNWYRAYLIWEDSQDHNN